MTVCFAGGCKHRSSATCKLFRFPAKRKMRKMWIKACRRGDRACTANDRLCSCHFLDGKKENGPTIFSYDKVSGLYHAEGFQKKKSKKSKQFEAKGPMDHDEIVTMCSKEGQLLSLKSSATLPMFPVQVFNPEPCQKDQCFAKRKFLSEKVQTLEDEMAGQSLKVAQLESQCIRLSIDNISQNRVPATARINELSQEIRDLEQQIAQLEKQPPPMSIQHIQDDKDKILLYTSFSLESFNLLAELLRKRLPLKYHAKWPVTRISLENQLLMTLMKLRLNCRDLDLADRFQVSRATVTNIVHTFIGALHRILYDDKVVVASHGPCRWKGAMPKSFEEFVAGQMAVDSLLAQQQQPEAAVPVPAPRIQVERTNARIKNFEILHHIPSMYKSLSGQICQLCVCLANLQLPVLKQIADSSPSVQNVTIG